MGFTAEPVLIQALNQAEICNHTLCTLPVWARNYLRNAKGATHLKSALEMHTKG